MIIRFAGYIIRDNGKGGSRGSSNTCIGKQKGNYLFRNTTI